MNTAAFRYEGAVEQKGRFSSVIGRIWGRRLPKRLRSIRCRIGVTGFAFQAGGASVGTVDEGGPFCGGWAELLRKARKSFYARVGVGSN